MVIEKRVYSTKSFQELHQIAAACAGDAKIIEKLIQELQFRRTAAAKKLLGELKVGGPISLTAQSKPRGALNVSAPIHKDCETLEASYALLRSTFSEVGELLARWGLTESMPHDMIENIAFMWIEKITSGHGNVIQTRDQLNKDLKQLGISTPDLMKNK